MAKVISHFLNVNLQLFLLFPDINPYCFLIKDFTALHFPANINFLA